MTKTIQLVVLIFALLTLPACGNSDEPDIPMTASSVFNSIYVDVVDAGGKSIIGHDPIASSMAFIDNANAKRVYQTIEIVSDTLIHTIFPLPMVSDMSFSDDGKTGCGESFMTIKIGHSKFKLKGTFHYSCTFPNKEMYGSNGIKLTEIKSDAPNVSISKIHDQMKVTIRFTE